jgi:hypothetical protein
LRAKGSRRGHGLGASTVGAALTLAALLSLTGLAMLGASAAPAAPPSAFGPLASNLTLGFHQTCPILCSVSGSAMAFDPSLGVAVAFGGEFDRKPGPWFLDNATWGYGRSGWTALPTTGDPTGRAEALMAYDDSSGQMVLFGGYDPNTLASLNDTWALTNQSWSNVSGSPSPPATSALTSSMVYDQKDGYVVLYDAAPGRAPQTWTYSAGRWTKIAGTGPSLSGGQSMSYDTAVGGAILFGGTNLTKGTLSNETWKFSAGRWTDLTHFSPASPIGRVGAILVPAGPTGKLLLYGGLGATVSHGGYGGRVVLNDTWTYQGGLWTRAKHTHAGPPASAGGAASYDSNSHCALVLGGATANQSFLSAFTEWCNGTWSPLPYPQGPADRTGASLAYDGGSFQTLLFGGANGRYFFNSTWAYAGGNWSQVRSVLAPSPRDNASMVYDSVDREMVLFGGYNGTYLSDTWVFVKGQWSRLTTPIAPPARESASIGYDPASGGVVLFGGYDGSYLNDTWIFHGGNWTNVSSLSKREPLARAGAAMSYDPAMTDLVLFGGDGPGKLGPYSDTWVLNHGVWSEVKVPAAGRPVGVAFAGLTYQPGVGLLLLGGFNASNARNHYPGLSAVLAGHNWTNVTPGAAALLTERQDFGMVYDPIEGYTVVFGGYWAGNVYGDTLID